MEYAYSISIHAPRVGSDASSFGAVSSVFDFNPRSPCGERRSWSFQAPMLRISIHAPRVGSDIPGAASAVPCRISIHAPRVGSDPVCACGNTFARTFQSTLPVWGATHRITVWLLPIIFQSTLPVWGATNRFQWIIKFYAYFNPRSPCGERLGEVRANAEGRQFQSTLPVWGATAENHNKYTIF